MEKSTIYRSNGDSVAVGAYVMMIIRHNKKKLIVVFDTFSKALKAFNEYKNASQTGGVYVEAYYPDEEGKNRAYKILD